MRKLLQEIYDYTASADIFVKGDQKLGRMEAAMKFFANPQNDVKILHIAGTSGKTSTSYYAAALLKNAGQKVGLTISPHAVDERERAQIDGKVLPWKTYEKYLREFFAKVKSARLEMSYSEFFFGFFFWLGRAMKLDYLVVETALGGLFDASNVATRADKICLLTDIGLDHVKILGDTLPEIARQKAGIIHRENEVFAHPQSAEIMAEFRAACAQNHANLHVVADDKTFADLPDFQSRNFSLALAAVEFTLARDGQKPLSSREISAARTINLPMRSEKFAYQNKIVLIDGAHNPQKLTAFAANFAKQFAGKSAVLVVGFSHNKIDDVAENLRILAQLSRKIIVTEFCENTVEVQWGRSVPAEILRDAARQAGFANVVVAKNPADALNSALATDAAVVAVVGSFYLLNHIRPILLDAKRAKML